MAYDPSPAAPVAVVRSDPRAPLYPGVAQWRCIALVGDAYVVFDRVACEAYAIGRARDTGRPGPTWYRNGKLCTGAASDCENHEDNQYLLKAYGSGTYEACTEDDSVCGEVVVER